MPRSSELHNTNRELIRLSIAGTNLFLLSNKLVHKQWGITLLGYLTDP